MKHFTLFGAGVLIVAAMGISMGACSSEDDEGSCSTNADCPTSAPLCNVSTGQCISGSGGAGGSGAAAGAGGSGAVAGTGATAGTGAVGGTGAAGGAGGTAGTAGTGGTGGGGTCDPGQALGATCMQISFGTMACDTCAQTNCCTEVNSCFADSTCAGLQNCASTQCASATDVNACVQSSCPSCLTMGAVNLANGISTCLQNNCATECM